MKILLESISMGGLSLGFTRGKTKLPEGPRPAKLVEALENGDA